MTTATAAHATPWTPASPQRYATYARRGMVASAHQYASEAGLEVLRHGGNAVDAAVATAAVLMTVRPWWGHLGGDTFMLLHHAPSERVVALNGDGAAPGAATLDRFRERGAIPSEGLWAATVPGTLHCWATALERFGTRPLGELLRPAIEYAEHGVPVTPDMRRSGRFPDTAAQFTPGGRVPGVGELLRQPDLGLTLRRIAEVGAADFYCGALAGDLVRFSEANSGPFSRADFAAHETEVVAPLAIEYRGYTIYEQPPPSQGIIVLLALNILQRFDLASLGQASIATTHLLIEALKLAFEDCLLYLGDPRHADVPLEMLLSEEHAREQAAPPDTTYLCAADEQGTMVSYIHSLFGGCGVVMGDTGVLMNNRMLGFNLEPSHPNCLAPGKRPLHTLNEYLVRRDGQTVLVGGTPGGHWQVQMNLQILTNLLDFGLDVQAAQEAPRFAIGSQWEAGDPTLAAESRFGEHVIAGLRALGHQVDVLDAWGAGSSVQLIARDPATGLYSGATEPRFGDGSVVGL
jgi:gamma-glutamyltranspeptidase / glutathione hydrolase